MTRQSDLASAVSAGLGVSSTISSNPSISAALRVTIVDVANAIARRVHGNAEIDVLCHLGRFFPLTLRLPAKMGQSRSHWLSIWKERNWSSRPLSTGP